MTAGSLDFGFLDPGMLRLNLEGDLLLITYSMSYVNLKLPLTQ